MGLKGVAEAEETNKQINATRLTYVPAAERGSIIYFTIADLALIGEMYQFSLEYFNALFLVCIQKSEKSSDLEQRLGGGLSDALHARTRRGDDRVAHEQPVVVRLLLLVVVLLLGVIRLFERRVAVVPLLSLLPLLLLLKLLLLLLSRRCEWFGCE